MIISPAKWSLTFRDFFEARIIPIIEKPAENDSLHAEVIKASYQHLLAQFKGLLELSKNPILQVFREKWFPWNSEGLTVIRNPQDLRAALERPGIDKLALIYALSFPNDFFGNEVFGLTGMRALFPRETWSEALLHLLNLGGSNLLERISNFQRILETLPIEKRWSFMQSLRQHHPNPEWPWTAWKSQSLKNQMVFELLPLVAPLDRLELFRQIYESHLIMGSCASGPGDLHEIFCDIIPEEHWAALLELIPPMNFTATKISEWASFLNFLPKRLLPSFLKWFWKGNGGISEQLNEFLKKFHKKKRIFVLKTFFEAMNEGTTVSWLCSWRSFLNPFQVILPDLEPKEKTEFLKLIASRIPFYSGRDGRRAFLEGLSEEDRLQFIEFLSGREALLFLQDLPKDHWTALGTRSGFTKCLADGELEDLWNFVPPHLWEEVTSHFQIDLGSVLANPIACAKAFKHVPRIELPRLERLLGPGKKWISLIDSFEKLCEFIKASSHISEPGEFSIVFTVLGDDLGSLISTKENILTLWELNPHGYQSLMKAIPVDRFLLSFEDYLPFLQKMQELKFHVYEMINFLKLVFSNQPQAFRHLEKILFYFEVGDHQYVTNQCLNFSINSLNVSPENFHLALYQAVGDTHWQAALGMVRESWGELKGKHQLTRVSDSVIPFLEQSLLEAENRLLQICRAHLSIIQTEEGFFSRIFEAFPSLRKIDVFKEIIAVDFGSAASTDLLSVAHWEHLPTADALVALELMLTRGFYSDWWNKVRDSYAKLNSLFTPSDWMLFVVSVIRQKTNGSLLIPIDILRKMHMDLSEADFARVFEIEDQEILEGLARVRDFDESMAAYGGSFLDFSFQGNPSIRSNDFDLFQRKISAYPERVSFLRALSRQVGASILAINKDQRFFILKMSDFSDEFFSLFKNDPDFCQYLLESYFFSEIPPKEFAILLFNNMNVIFSSDAYVLCKFLLRFLPSFSLEVRIHVFSRLPRQNLALYAFHDFTANLGPIKGRPLLLKALKAYFETGSAPQKILDFYATRISKTLSRYSDYFIYSGSAKGRFIGFKSNSNCKTFFGELLNLFEPLSKLSFFEFRFSPVHLQAQKIIQEIGEIESQFRLPTETMHSLADIERLEKKIDKALLNYLGDKLQEIEIEEKYSDIAMALQFAIVLVGFRDKFGCRIDKPYYLSLETRQENAIAAPKAETANEPILGTSRTSPNLSAFFQRQAETLPQEDSVQNSNNDRFSP